MPSALVTYVGEQLIPVKMKGVRNWLDDIIIPTATLLRKLFDLIRAGRLSVDLQKSAFCFPVVEWLGMTIDCHGTRPEPSKIDAITPLSRPTTVEDVRVLLDMSGYLRQFIPHYSTITAPISDLLREPRFRGKRARRLKLPWGEFRQQAKGALIKALTSPPILALPDWDKPFRLHMDASEIGAGVVLKQFSDHLREILIYASHKWFVIDAKISYGPEMSRNTLGCG